jgi:hypothetical protein
MSVEELASRSNIRADVLSKFESHFHTLPADQLFWLCKVLRTATHLHCRELWEERRQHCVQWLQHSRRAQRGWETRNATEESKPRSPAEEQELHRERNRERTRQWRARKRARVAAEAMAFQASGCSQGL